MNSRKTIYVIWSVLLMAFSTIPEQLIAQLKDGEWESNFDMMLSRNDGNYPSHASFSIDSQNVVWYTDQNKGLYEYDGERSYYHSFKNENYKLESTILLEHVNNNLLVSVSENEIIAYHIPSKTEYIIFSSESNFIFKSVNPDLYSFISLDDKSFLLYTQRFTGIVSYSVESNNSLEFSYKPLNKSILEFFQEEGIVRLFESKTNRIWAAGKSGIFSLDITENNLLDTLLHKVDWDIDNEPRVHCIYQENDTSVWFNVGYPSNYKGELYHFDLKDDHIQKVENLRLVDDGNSIQQSKIIHDEYGYMWLRMGLHAKGLYKLKITNKKSVPTLEERYPVDPNHKFGFKDFTYSSMDLLKDHSGGIWFITDRSVLKNDPTSYQFTFNPVTRNRLWSTVMVREMEYDSTTDALLMNTPITFIKEDSTGYEDLFDIRKHKEYTGNPHAVLHHANYVNDSIIIIKLANPRGLYKYNYITGKRENLIPRFLDNEKAVSGIGLYSDYISLTVDSDTDTMKWFFIDKELTQCFDIKHDSLSFDKYTLLLYLGEHMVFYNAATNYFQIAKLVIEKEKIQRIQSVKRFHTHENLEAIQALNDHELILSYSDGSLFNFNIRDIHNGENHLINLPSPCYAIFAESDSIIWARNDRFSNYVYRVNLNTRSLDKIHNHIRLGARINDNFSGKMAKNGSGRVYLPIRGGYWAMVKENETSHYPATPTIRRISTINTKDESLIISNTTIQSGNKLKFNSNTKGITIEFSALHYKDSDNNNYSFRLKGQDKSWSNPGPTSYAEFRYLQPGNYTFELKAANSDGVWSDTIDSVRFQIMAPWYWSLASKTIYLLFIGALVYWYFKFREQQNIEKDQIQKLKELDALRTKLYTNITHEFRTPLTVIQGIADNIQEKLGRDQKRTIGSGLNMIKRSGDRLLTLVNQMLDLDKMEAGKYNLRFIQSDIISYLHYLTDSFQSVAESRNITLAFYSEPTELIMDFDPENIQKLVSNLLSNALKFTPAQGQVIVHVNTTGKDEKEEIIIKIKDSGIGIPEDELEHIFDRFYRLGDEDQDTPIGSGIGLALSKELIKVMNGRITVNSSPGKGSEFTISLPVTKSAEKSDPGFSPHMIKDTQEESVSLIQSPLSDDALPNVLIVEDNRDVAKFIAICLKRQYNISYAPDGKTGHEMALNDPPDIILADVMMPKLNGIQLLKLLKENEITSHIPVVMITAKSEEEDVVTGYDAGADAYLIKPFNKKELLVRMEKLLESRKSLREKYSQIPGSKAISKESNPEEKFLSKIMSLIEQHLDDPDYGSEELAKDLNLSSSQVYRKIKYLTGKSTAIYLRWLRLNHALHMLESSDKSISEIAYSCGFKNISWFSRAFKTEFGYPPSEIIK